MCRRGSSASASARCIRSTSRWPALRRLLTRRTDELIAAVNGSAADPVRALSALTGQLRSEVADSSDTLRSVAAEDDPTLGRNDRRVAEAVDRAGGGVRRLAARNSNPQRSRARSRLSPDTGDRLRHELTSVIDNLGQTSAVIDRAIGSAGDRLAAVQSGLADTGRRIPACARRHRLTGRDSGPALSHHPVRREHARRAARPACGGARSGRTGSRPAAAVARPRP